MNLIEHFIDGKITKGSSKKTSKIFNPATGEQSAEVNLASKVDVDLAVQKAKQAFSDWSKKPPAQRARVIFKFKELIEKNSDEIIKLIVSEHGKVYEDAKGSLIRGLEVVEFACGIPQMLNLDINEVGVNFSKGCFPGQEVVARLHYLGKAKRRLFAFKSDSPLSIGDTLHCAESKSAKASGSVVSKVKFGANFYCLATLEVENKDNKITINNDKGPTLVRIHNE